MLDKKKISETTDFNQGSIIIVENLISPCQISNLSSEINLIKINLALRQCTITWHGRDRKHGVFDEGEQFHPNKDTFVSLANQITLFFGGMFKNKYSFSFSEICEKSIHTLRTLDRGNNGCIDRRAFEDSHNLIPAS
jgi:hypothetical protein